MRARVYKSTGTWYNLITESGEAIQARLKGKFKMEDLTSTNPIAVGDFVEVNSEEGDMVITEIHSRNNYINRISPHNRNLHHIVAANLEQSVLFATLREPRTSTGFIDRFLVVCEAYHIPAVIVFNKTDLYKHKDFERLGWITEMYQEIGYKVFHISIKEGKGLNALSEQLKNKTSLLSGHSGVGKSSFINFLFPGLEIKTQEVSEWSGKGMHTTTFAEMYDLPQGGQIVDTPGIREMGLVDISKQELSHYFPEMRALLQGCKFNNCLHYNETACAVKDAVGGKVHEERYISYLKILESIEK